MALTIEAEKQNQRALLKLQQKGGKKDMTPAIAAAVYIGTRAGK